MNALRKKQMQLPHKITYACSGSIILKLLSDIQDTEIIIIILIILIIIIIICDQKEISLTYGYS